VIVAGDFNTFWGTHEIYLFMRASGLRSANTENCSPFLRACRGLNWISCSSASDIDVSSFRIPAVTWSDHRPLVCDFSVNRTLPVAADAT
jgi:endonuclease/exonuclease/phosphatase (EEP) superfamily protein YafD